MKLSRLVFFLCTLLTIHSVEAQEQQEPVRISTLLSFTGYYNAGQVDAIAVSDGDIWGAHVFGQDVNFGLSATIHDRFLINGSLNWNRLPFGVRYDIPAEANNLPSDLFTRGLPPDFSTSSIGVRLDAGYRHRLNEKVSVAGYGFVAPRYFVDAFFSISGTQQIDSDSSIVVMESLLRQRERIIAYFGAGLAVSYHLNQFNEFTVALESSMANADPVSGTVVMLPELPSRKEARFNTSGNYLGLRLAYRFQIIPWE